MKKLMTLSISACVMLFLTTSAFAPPQGPDAEGGGQQKDGMALLEESHELMKQLAIEDLPLGIVGEETQQKEGKIIKNLDDLIQMVLDQDAEEIKDDDEEKENKEGCENCEKKQSNPQNSGKKQKGEQSGQPGGQEPAPMQGNTAGGNPKGDKFGDAKDTSFEGTKADEWGLLPEREYKEVKSATKTVVPKGYDELLERFRRIMAREGARLAK